MTQQLLTHHHLQSLKPQCIRCQSDFPYKFWSIVRSQARTSGFVCRLNIFRNSRWCRLYPATRTVPQCSCLLLRKTHLHTGMVVNPCHRRNPRAELRPDCKRIVYCHLHKGSCRLAGQELQIKKPVALWPSRTYRFFLQSLQAWSFLSVGLTFESFWLSLWVALYRRLLCALSL